MTDISEIASVSELLITTADSMRLGKEEHFRQLSLLCITAFTKVTPSLEPNQMAYALKVMRQVKEAMERHDWINMADCFEYELAPLFDQAEAPTS